MEEIFPAIQFNEKPGSIHGMGGIVLDLPGILTVEEDNVGNINSSLCYLWKSFFVFGTAVIK